MAGELPSHTVYVNVGGPDSKITKEVGAAWEHESGGGFAVRLFAHSLDGKYVVFPAKNKTNEKEA